MTETIKCHEISEERDKLSYHFACGLKLFSIFDWVVQNPLDYYFVF